MVFIERVIPLEISPSTNIIRCQRKYDVSDLSTKLEIDVKDVIDDQTLEPCVIYAVCKFGQKRWSRATVKFFRRSDNVPVLQLMDGSGVFDFDPNKTHARKVKSDELKNKPLGQFKMLIYAVGKYKQDKEFDLIFDEMLKNKEVTAIFDILERKPNAIHECYAGDFFTEFRGNLLSFREIIIQQKITCPAHVKSIFNQRILQTRANTFAERNANRSILSIIGNVDKITSEDDNESTEIFEPIEVAGRFHLLQVVGEGSVSVFFYLDFNLFIIIILN